LQFFYDSCADCSKVTIEYEGLTKKGNNNILARKDAKTKVSVFALSGWPLNKREAALSFGRMQGAITFYIQPIKVCDAFSIL
jgi:hypothetical protein